MTGLFKQPKNSPASEPAATSTSTITPTATPLPMPVDGLINPGFESGLNGWDGDGNVEENGYTGEYRLNHTGGKFETRQTINGIPNGWVTLRVWVRTTGMNDFSATISLADCGGDLVSASMPVRKNSWMQLVVSTEVTNNKCTIVLSSSSTAEDWVGFDDIELLTGRTALSIWGADISSLKKSEDMGGVYLDENGNPDDAILILADHGLNYARLRVWVDSPDGYHGRDQILAIAKRLKEQNIKLLLDFHYSDSWADPGKQPKPASWEGLDFAGVKQALYDHTFEICSALVAQGTPPDIVQIGNEINNGMVWPDGKNDRDFKHLAELINEGIRAVKDCSPESKIMLQVAEGGKNDIFRWWFDAILAEGVEFDLIGVSYYPYWHGTLSDFQNNLNDIALRYNKDIIVVETAYPFTSENDDFTDNIIKFQTVDGYPATPEGQAHMLSDIMTIIRDVPNGHGLGFFWWDATWTAVQGNGWDPAHSISGNNWENQALFDFDDKPLPALDLFGQP